MKKQEVVREYHFSDATLVTKGLEKVAFMERDKPEFEPYGITTELVAVLKDNLNAFAARITDIEALGDQSQAALLKDLKAEELRTALRTIMARVELKYGVNSPKYKKFGTDTLSLQSDAELNITAKRVVRVGTEFLPELTDTGLTATLLEGITTLNDAFTTLLINLKIEIGDRDIEQEDRVEAGNAVYATLMKYTKIGQSIWESTDVSKFNDYIIYNTISGEPEEAPPPTP
ncbi:hypothetical protein [Flavobacterium sp. XGLA_31]|uniref:hypothetical protein n=1 Tax=Flavobacterium sp. XGLA_31 TaxID=3447666 RepID=UPI003F2E2A44